MGRVAEGHTGIPSNFQRLKHPPEQKRLSAGGWRLCLAPLFRVVVRTRSLIMVYVAVGATVILGVACIGRISSGGRSRRRDYLSERRGLPVLGVQIICGDCSGEGARPIKTYMDLHARCATCGGKSFMLASRRGSGMDQRRAAMLLGRRSAGQEPAKSGRLLPFRTGAGRGRPN